MNSSPSGTVLRWPEFVCTDIGLQGTRWVDRKMENGTADLFRISRQPAVSDARFLWVVSLCWYGSGEPEQCRWPHDRQAVAHVFACLRAPLTSSSDSMPSVGQPGITSTAIPCSSVGHPKTLSTPTTFLFRSYFRVFVDSWVRKTVILSAIFSGSKNRPVIHRKLAWMNPMLLLFSSWACTRRWRRWEGLYPCRRRW